MCAEWAGESSLSRPRGGHGWRFTARTKWQILSEKQFGFFRSQNLDFLKIRKFVFDGATVTLWQSYLLFLCALFHFDCLKIERLWAGTRFLSVWVFLEKTQKPRETTSGMNMSQLTTSKSMRTPSVEQASIHCDKGMVILESQRAFPAVTWLTVDRGPAGREISW